MHDLCNAPLQSVSFMDLLSVNLPVPPTELTTCLFSQLLHHGHVTESTYTVAQKRKGRVAVNNLWNFISISIIQILRGYLYIHRCPSMHITTCSVAHIIRIIRLEKNSRVLTKTPFPFPPFLLPFPFSPNPVRGSAGERCELPQQPKLNLVHFKWKIWHSGENNFSDVHEQLHWLSPVSGKTLRSPNFFWSILLQRLCSVDASGYMYRITFTLGHTTWHRCVLWPWHDAVTGACDCVTVYQIYQH